MEIQVKVGTGYLIPDVLTLEIFKNGFIYLAVRIDIGQRVCYDIVTQGYMRYLP